MKIKATQSIKVEFHCTEEKLADEFLEFINNQYNIEFELEEVRDHEWELTALETADGWYSPAVMYTKNGDGYPEEYDVEFEVVDEYLLAECREFENKTNDDEKFCIERVNCEIVDDYDY